MTEATAAKIDFSTFVGGGLHSYEKGSEARRLYSELKRLVGINDFWGNLGGLRRGKVVSEDQALDFLEEIGSEEGRESARRSLQILTEGIDINDGWGGTFRLSGFHKGDKNEGKYFLDYSCAGP